MGNFLQFDQNKVNIMGDGDYSASSYRTNGCISGEIAPSDIHNKVLYQVSTMVTAFANMLIGKGLSISDSDIATLASTLSTLVTNTDMVNYAAPKAGNASQIFSAADGTTGKEVVNYSQLQGLLPTGCITMWPLESPPTGWLECNGAAISRTGNISLFNVIGIMYGAGNGSSTFNLPDFRGYFVRGWNHSSGNDPDASSRTNRGDGTVGDHVGTKQTDQVIWHQHNVPGLVATDGGSNPENVPGFWLPFGKNITWPTDNAGGNETRPKNISTMFIIKK